MGMAGKADVSREEIEVQASRVGVINVFPDRRARAAVDKRDALDHCQGRQGLEIPVLILSQLGRCPGGRDLGDDIERGDIDPTNCRQVVVPAEGGGYAQLGDAVHAPARFWSIANDITQ